jgi:hypothetical protein
MSALSSVLSGVLKNPSVEGSIIQLGEQLGQKLLAASSEPAAVKQIAEELITEAGALAGAILGGTSAQAQATPANVCAAEQVVAAGS